MSAAPEPVPVTIAANGLSFVGLQWGPSGRGIPVLCLHGFPQRCTSWRDVAERLAEVGLLTIAVDQRGYSPGARPLDVSAYAMPHLVADVAAIIDALGGRVHLVGHDWGGVVGWQVAARRPELVASWTAVSTPNQSALNEVLAADPTQRQRFGYILGLRDPAAEQRLSAHDWAPFAASYQGRVAPERMREDIAFFAQPGVLTAALNWYRAMSPTDAADLGTVTVPTTYLWGSEDVAFGAAAAAATARWVSAPYRFVPLEGASHWLPDEAPDTLAGAIAERVLDG